MARQGDFLPINYAAITGFKVLLVIIVTIAAKMARQEPPGAP
jgi:hypothetical protein